MVVRMGQGAEALLVEYTLRKTNLKTHGHHFRHVFIM